MNLQDIIEVEEAGQRRANELLAAGFQIVAIEGKTWEQKRRGANLGSADTFIRRDVRYVMGRRADEPPFPERQPYEVRESAP